MVVVEAGVSRTIFVMVPTCCRSLVVLWPVGFIILVLRSEAILEV